MSAPELHRRLQQLAVERLEAADVGLAANPIYMAELDEELAECREAYVGAAVTEIATLRAELSGPLLG